MPPTLILGRGYGAPPHTSPSALRREAPALGPQASHQLNPTLGRERVFSTQTCSGEDDANANIPIFYQIFYSLHEI